MLIVLHKVKFGYPFIHLFGVYTLITEEKL